MTFVPPQIWELSAGTVFISSVGISTMSTYLYKGRRGLLFPLGSSRVFEENLQNNLYFFQKKLKLKWYVFGWYVKIIYIWFLKWLCWEMSDKTQILVIFRGNNQIQINLGTHNYKLPYVIVGKFLRFINSANTSSTTEVTLKYGFFKKNEPLISWSFLSSKLYSLVIKTLKSRFFYIEWVSLQCFDYRRI